MQLFKKKELWMRNYNIDNFNQRNGRYNENTGWAKKAHPNLILLYRAIDLNNTKKPLGLAYLIYLTILWKVSSRMMKYSMRYKILVNLSKFQLLKMNTKLKSNKKKNDNELNCSTMLAHDYKFLWWLKINWKI